MEYRASEWKYHESLDFYHAIEGLIVIDIAVNKKIIGIEFVNQTL